jgi:hypothetical protein
MERKHIERLKELADQTGFRPSEVFRLLLENATLEPRPTPVSRLPIKDNSADVRQDKASAVVSSNL